MATQTYNLDYVGYWLEKDKSSVPNKSGVYTVYRSSYDATKDTVDLKEILYIGESGAVRDRLADHERTEDWKGHLSRGEVLCFNFAQVASSSRERVEAALINRHKPPENVEYVDSFPFHQTIVTTAGKNALLSPRFTVG